MHFIDEVKIYLCSGAGGNGCLSFRREANIPRGGPDGGDGGKGGSVIFRAVEGLTTLIDFRYQQHFKAERGENGKGKLRSGRGGEDLFLKCPTGTQIFCDETDDLAADLTEPGQEVLLLPGGEGGVGNARFKSSVNRAPRRIIEGGPFAEMWVWLRLKLLSDAGLVGKPNAGKSSLLSRLSRARPKVADYPFTTLYPHLGVVYCDGKEFVAADIPGLIEDAHLGAGLGVRFLKHVERCGALAHLIDGSASDPAAEYLTVRHELEAYGGGLEEKPELVVLNKCDALSPEEREAKRAALSQVAGGADVFCISAVTGEGVQELARALLALSEARRAAERRLALGEAASRAEAEAPADRPAFVPFACDFDE